MKALYATLLLTALIPFSANAAGDCDTHAKHIDHEIGADDALAAYDVLHGDHADDNNVIAKLKKEHPDVEHELEEFVKAGCSRHDLEAHADDPGNPAHH